MTEEEAEALPMRSLSAEALYALALRDSPVCGSACADLDMPDDAITPDEDHEGRYPWSQP